MLRSRDWTWCRLHWNRTHARPANDTSHPDWEWVPVMIAHQDDVLECRLHHAFCHVLVHPRERLRRNVNSAGEAPLIGSGREGHHRCYEGIPQFTSDMFPR